MYANVRQLLVSLPVSIFLSLGFIDPAGANLVEADWLDTRDGFARFGDTHRKPFTDLLEFHISSLSDITVTVKALNWLPGYNLDELEVALFTEAPSHHGGHRKHTDKLGEKLYSDSGLNLTFSLQDLEVGDYFIRISGEPETHGRKSKFSGHDKFFGHGHGHRSLGGIYVGSLSVTPSFTPGPSTPPVPEPEVWAMMLAGLGLLGYWQSRRPTAATALAA